MKRAWIVVVLLLIAGCDEPAIQAPNARIVPNSGLVPYEAIVKVDPVADTYVFHLPDRDVTQENPQLEITVDRIDYRVEVDCVRGDRVVTGSARAIGTNAAPRIVGLRINGRSDLWMLKPFERTMIEPVVLYAGEWSLGSLQVTGSIYGPYSVFHPPYEAGVHHAEWHGQIWPNAGIVYPVYLSVENSSGRPYSPTGLDEGYPTSYTSTNQFQFSDPNDADVEIPAQDGTIRVFIVDEFGRTTSESFGIPISAAGYTDTPDD
jgi:hypothetical protein